MSSVIFFLMVGQYQRIWSVNPETGQVIKAISSEAREISHKRLCAAVIRNQPMICWQSGVSLWECVFWEDVIYESITIVETGGETLHLLVDDEIDMWRQLPSRVILRD